MRIGRVVALAMVVLVSAGAARAQEGADVEARSRELAERMRQSLEQQSRALSRMQRDLERASRSDSKVRDSIVRVTSREIAELAREIARVQAEADRAQARNVVEASRAQLRVQIASARAMADVARALADQQRRLTFSTRSFPRGYLGVSLSGEQNTELRDGKVFTLFTSPAVIASVEAGSPAAQGGLQAGDTILAFGKVSLPGAVPLGEIMTPGERLAMRIRRDGRERTQTVVVGERQFEVRSFDVEGMSGKLACPGEDCTLAITMPRGARAPTAPTAVPGQASMPPAPTAMAPPAGVFGRTQSWSSTDYSIAGAVMTTITDDLEDLTGVDEGILVLRVAPGTPAATSGLRGGDVIIRVNDEECEGVRDLQIAVQQAMSRGMKRVSLVVNRQKKERGITLQW